MGKKTNPAALRAYSRNKWWSPVRSYGQFVREDIAIRKFVRNLPNQMNIGNVIIARSANALEVTIPLLNRDVEVFGLKREKLDLISQDLAKYLNREARNVKVNIHLSSSSRFENNNSSFRNKGVSLETLDPQLIANQVATSLVGGNFKFMKKNVMRQVMSNGAKGLLLTVAGRLGGASIARLEKYRKGSVPQQTLKSKILAGKAQAKTKRGICGVKVVICLEDRYGTITKSL